MSLTSSEMTPADIAAVTNNGSNGGFGFGGDTSWYILILFMFMMGWGRNGFGSGGGGTGSDIQRGFDQSSVMNGITNLGNTVSNGFSNAAVSQCNQTTSLLQGLNGIQSQLSNDRFDIVSALTNSTNTLNNTMMQNEMSRQQCCCDTKQAIADLKYTIATEACNDRAAVSAGVQTVLDKLCQQEIEALKTQNSNLQTQLNMAALAASQNAQTAALQADNAAQTQYIVNRVAPYPVPSYNVPNPFVGMNYGGCGCAAV